MKKIFLMGFVMSVFLLFAGCGDSEPELLSCGEYEHGASWADDCNTCMCDNGQISCTEIACEVEEDDSMMEDFVEQLNLLKFNSNLTDYEEDYLRYYEQKYPSSRIYHIKTTLINCDGCYELYYKKDREILKIKVLNYQIKQQTRISQALEEEIENEDVCTLFGGEWDTCPSICPTDEEICVMQCGEPTCVFEEGKLVLKKIGEVCGGLDEGDCEYGLTCKYANSQDDYGVCVAN